MDNQEAIKMLTAKVECIRRETSGTDIDCNLRNCDDCELCYAQGETGEQREALNMAISALQAQDLQPTCNELAKDICVPCKDTISRQAAIDVAENAFVRGLLASSDIRKLPSVQPERKHGEWTKEAHCPFCDFAPWYEKDIHTLSYCPNCGADLRAERRTDD